MASGESNIGGDTADQIYSDPARALDRARSVLARESAPAKERADALWTLGRSAYYGNRIPEAVDLLRQALPLVEDPATLAEVLLTLAPALSKEGHPVEALEMLEDLGSELGPEILGQLRNQRGIILTDLGRLPEAKVEMEQALIYLEAAGDQERQPRTLINLGAVASMMGDLADAEHWYRLAREKTLSTGQDVLAAMIEGNLGYVEARRGDYSMALDWYQRAGASFERLGEVGLLVAVLEADHARTLLDLGLAADAAEAAGKAVFSSTGGGNQMLETQSRCLLAEALIQLGEHRAAGEAIERGIELAKRLGQKPWELRALYLRSRLGGSPNQPGPVDPMVEIDELLRFSWVREAYESALQHARRLSYADPQRALDLLINADRLTADLDVGPVDRALGALLVADLQGDLPRAQQAFESALDALAERRDLMGSVEMRATITRLLGPVEEVALTVAMRSPSPASAALQVLESTGTIRDSKLDVTARGAADHDQQVSLRSARIALEESKLAGDGVEAAASAVRGLERSILQHRRTKVAHGGGVVARKVATKHRPPSDTGFVAFTVHNDRILAITQVGDSTDLVDLGAFDYCGRLARRQRSSLRRLADDRRRADGQYERLEQTNSQLEAYLFGPLGLGLSDRVVIAPSPLLRDISWGGLPWLRKRPITVVSSFDSWSSDAERAAIGRASILGGPDLDAAGEELRVIAELWNGLATPEPGASCETATAAFADSDLVHVAAHGRFRSDNPFFSSLLFSDGELSILEMSELRALPAAVILSSCDAAATANSGGGDTTAVGTATELRRLGASFVAAPTNPVNDVVSAEWSILLHQALAAGNSVDEAMLSARMSLLATGDPRRMANAQSFQLFGGRSTRLPLEVLPKA